MPPSLTEIRDAARVLGRHVYHGLRSKVLPAARAAARDTLTAAAQEYAGRATRRAQKIDLVNELSRLAVIATHPDAAAHVPASPWDQILAALAEEEGGPAADVRPPD